jgi:hypothetical protein
MTEEPKKTEPKLLDEPVKIKELIFMTMYTLEGKAWAYLGLTSHPETQKPLKDLTEARLAIDAIDVLYKLIESDLELEEKKDIQIRLTNLRLNFTKDPTPEKS